MSEIDVARDFEWDSINLSIGGQRGVSTAEAEQVFFNAPLLTAPRLSAPPPVVVHGSGAARAASLGPISRWHALGRTDRRRLLHITLALRDRTRKIRVISARDFHRRNSHRHEELHMSHETLKAIPDFLDESEERAFWETQDSSEYVDWSRARPTALPHLKPSTKTISLRLPQHLLDSIKTAAHARDVPYQSLIKIWLQEKAAQRR